MLYLLYLLRTCSYNYTVSVRHLDLLSLPKVVQRFLFIYHNFGRLEHQGAGWGGRGWGGLLGSKRSSYFRFLIFPVSSFSPLFWMTGSVSRCQGEFWISRKAVNAIEYLVAPTCILIWTPLIILNAILQFFILHSSQTVYFQLVFKSPRDHPCDHRWTSLLLGGGIRVSKNICNKKVQPF